MKTALYGRVLFGVSAVLLGVVGLIYRNSDLWHHLHAAGMPLAAIVVWCLTIAQIAGGIAMLYPGAARAASIVLGAVYLFFSLATIPGMIAAPGDYVQYVDFFEKFSLVCGALAVFAYTDPSSARAAVLGEAVRLAFGICTASFAWAQIVYFQYTASLVPAWVPPNQAFWTVLTTVAFALAALAILINLQARLALRLMTLMIALFGILVWIPHIVAHPRTLSNWTEIASNYLMAGAAWLVADLYRRVPSELRELRAR